MQELSLFNTLTKQKERFEPIKVGEIGLYVCGMTVYDYCHIGHARVLVGFDMMARYFRAIGYQVNYVRNITDIDDKIIKRAHENNEDFQALTRRFIDAMHEDENALHVLSPNEEPRATDHIDQMVAMIQILIDRQHAYVAENGDVYYDVTSFESYGQLAQQDVEAMRAGSRVEVVEVKRNPLDFVLWKIAKPGEPHWSSPWGEGRPGWHIECSAMSTHLLGPHFDLHGGGGDLRFPHHQNEIAQSEGAHQCRYVNTWMHMGHVQVNKEKMSKSLGNFFTIREILDQYPAEVLRYFLIASHYRSPINYSQENLESAKAALMRFYMALRGLPDAAPAGGETFVAHFHAAMCDDFNTPVALSALFDMARDINTLRQANKIDAAAGLAAQLRRLADVLGILYEDPAQFLQGDIEYDEFMAIEALVQARQQAREEKNWARADELRDELAAKHIIVEDQAGASMWRKEG